jgi:hypothetical protein
MKVDGSRKRRAGQSVKAKWYAYYRTIRQSNRFGLCVIPVAFNEYIK